MPQGDISKGPAGAAVGGIGAGSREAYARKTDSRRDHRQGYGGYAAAINPNYKAALHGITRNIEQLVAGKLVQSGAKVHLTDIKRVGAAEVKDKAQQRKRANKVSELLDKGRNLKGVRGEFNADELAELDPELKGILDHRKATAGGGTGGAAKRARAAAAEAGSAEGGSGSGSGSGSGAAGAAEGSGMTASGAIKGKGARSLKRVAALSAGAASSGAAGVFASEQEVAATFGADFA
jgi:hypothetical protein